MSDATPPSQRSRGWACSTPGPASGRKYRYAAGRLAKIATWIASFHEVVAPWRRGLLLGDQGKVEPGAPADFRAEFLALTLAVTPRVKRYAREVFSATTASSRTAAVVDQPGRFFTVVNDW